MEYLTVTELKNNMKSLIDEVAEGKVLTITKNGKPVAKIEPFKEKSSTPLWKRPVEKVVVKGGKDSTTLIREMRDEGY